MRCAPRAVAVDRFAQPSGFERKTTRALVPDPHADRRGLSRYQIGGLWLGHRERAAHHVGTRRQSAVDRRTGQFPVVGDWMSGRGARLAPTGDGEFVEPVADVFADLSGTIARPIHPKPITSQLFRRRGSNGKAIQSIGAVEWVTFVGIGQGQASLIHRVYSRKHPGAKAKLVGLV